MQNTTGNGYFCCHVETYVEVFQDLPSVFEDAKSILNLDSALSKVLIKQILIWGTRCSMIECFEQERHEWIWAVPNYIWFDVLVVYPYDWLL